MWERVTGPMVVHAFKDAVKDALAAASSSKGAHFANAPAHFDEESFDDVSGAQAFPMSFGRFEKGP